MGAKDNVTLVENTGGQLRYLQSPSFLVSDVGIDVDFSDTDIFTFENGRLKCNHLEIFNTGPNDCMIAFDTQATTINSENIKTLGFTIYSGKPFNYISLDGEADSMSLKTLSGETATIKIIVW